jgi:hypothetical protein
MKYIKTCAARCCDLHSAYHIGVIIYACLGSKEATEQNTNFVQDIATFVQWISSLPEQQHRLIKQSSYLVDHIKYHPRIMKLTCNHWKNGLTKELKYN